MRRTCILSSLHCIGHQFYLSLTCKRKNSARKTRITLQIFFLGSTLGKTASVSFRLGRGGGGPIGEKLTATVTGRLNFSFNGHGLFSKTLYVTVKFTPSLNIQMTFSFPIESVVSSPSSPTRKRHSTV